MGLSKLFTRTMKKYLKDLVNRCKSLGNGHGHAFQIRNTYLYSEDNCFEMTVPSSLHHRPVTAAVTALSNYSIASSVLERHQASF
jgi:hypothetical protein